MRIALLHSSDPLFPRLMVGHYHFDLPLVFIATSLCGYVMPLFYNIVAWQ
jgi:hypothetical protein